MGWEGFWPVFFVDVASVSGFYFTRCCSSVYINGSSSVQTFNSRISMESCSIRL